MLLRAGFRPRPAGRRHKRVTGGCEFLALVEPPDVGDRARLQHAERTVVPTVPLRVYIDRFGKRCWRLTADGTALTFRYEATFAVPDAPDEVDLLAAEVPVPALPDQELHFALPSRFCQSDLLLEDAWQLFGSAPPGHARVQAICLKNLCRNP